MGWQQTLGAALVSGSQMAGRNRLEKIEETKRNEARELQNLQMALMREDQTMQQTREAREADQFAYQRVKDQIDMAGVGGELEDAVAAEADRLGLGGRLSPKVDAVPAPPIAETETSMNVTASMPPGRRTVLPNYEQQQEMAKNADVVAARSRRDAALAQIAKLTPEQLTAMPFIQSNDLWQRAHGTNLPEDPQQRMNEIIKQAELAGANTLANTRLIGENQQAVQNLKLSGNDADDFTNLFRHNSNMLTQIAVSQQYATGKAADAASIAQQANDLARAQLAQLKGFAFNGPQEPVAPPSPTTPPATPGGPRRAGAVTRVRGNQN